MRISVVVAIKDRFSLLRNCLDSWSDHDYPDYEMILVDDGSQRPDFIVGATKEYSTKISDLSYIRIDGTQDRTPTVAWNAGIRKSTGDFVIVTSGDLIISQKDLLKKMIEGVKERTRLSVLTFFLSSAMTDALNTIPWRDNPTIIQSLPGFMDFDPTHPTKNRDRKASWLAGIHTYLTGQLKKDWEYFGLFREDNIHLVADQDVHLREIQLRWTVDTPKEIHAYHQFHAPPKVTAGGSFSYKTDEQGRLLV